jgi:hypothetical protein
VARARTTAVLLIRTEETSNCANVDAAIRPIADKAEAGEAEQHHRPCRRLGNDGSGTKSHHLPSVIDAEGVTAGRARQASHVDDLAINPHMLPLALRRTAVFRVSLAAPETG